MATIDFDINCVGCGTNLRACDSQGTCSRCGRSAAETLELTLVDPADLHVSGDLSCIGCGYNLRTLAARAVCPECGKSITSSLSLDPLRRTDPDWLRTMRWGAYLLAIACLMGLLSSVLGRMLFEFLRRLFSASRGFTDFGLPWVACVTDIIWCLGVFLVTRPEPGPGNETRDKGIRLCARMMAGAMLISVCGSELLGILTEWYSGSRRGFAAFGIPGTPWYHLTGAIDAVCWILVLVYLRRLAHRWNRRTHLLTLVIWLVVIQVILRIAAGGPFGFLLGRPFRRPMGSAAFLSHLWPITALAVRVPAFVLFRRLGMMFESAKEKVIRPRATSDYTPHAAGSPGPLLDFDLACSQCGASLRGIGLEGSCAECGAAVGATLHLPAIAAETMSVQQDVPCWHCGYNVRTLSVRSLCPECGSPVAPSLSTRELVFARPGWLREQRAMATLTLACMLVPVLFVGIAFLAILLGEWALMLLLMLSAPAGITAVVGFTLLCSPGEGYSHPKSATRLPAVCAGLFVAGLCLFILTTAIVPVHFVSVLAGGGGVCCCLGMPVCTAWSIRYKGERARSRRLRRLATAWAYSLVAMIAWLFAATLILAVFGEPRRRPDIWLLGGWAAFALFAVAAYTLGLITMGVCRSVFSDTLRRQTNKV